jgi:hypothetical protein
MEELKKNGYLTREEVPKYLQKNPRFKKLIEEGEKILNGHYDTPIITKKEEEKPNESYQTLNNSGITKNKKVLNSIEDKVTDSYSRNKDHLNRDYDPLDRKKHEDASTLQKNYRSEMIQGLVNNNVTDKIRGLRKTPLASEESIKDWGEHEMVNRSKSSRIMLFNDLIDILEEECEQKGWGIDKYKSEISRMHKKIFPEIE